MVKSIAITNEKVIIIVWNWKDFALLVKKLDVLPVSAIIRIHFANIIFPICHVISFFLIWFLVKSRQTDRQKAMHMLWPNSMVLCATVPEIWSLIYWQTYSPPRYMGGDMLCHAARSLWVVPEWSLLFKVSTSGLWMYYHSESNDSLDQWLFTIFTLHCASESELDWHSYIQEGCTESDAYEPTVHAHRWAKK